MSDSTDGSVPPPLSPPPSPPLAAPASGSAATPVSPPTSESAAAPDAANQLDQPLKARARRAVKRIPPGQAPPATDASVPGGVTTHASSVAGPPKLAAIGAGPRYRPGVLGTIGPNHAATSTAAPRPVSTVPRTPTQLSRQQILEATAACLLDLGYDGTTIRRIAKQLDCAVGSIYRYFDDKRALLAAVVQGRFEPIIDEIERGLPVRAVAASYIDVATEQPELYRLMFWLACVGQTTHGNTLPRVICRVIDGWAQQLDDPAAAAAFWNQLHGEIMQGRRDERLTLPRVPDHSKP